MRGTYRFYQNGALVAEHENLITDAGKRLLYRYLAGQAANFGDGIGLGVGGSAPATTDTRLTFEVARARVSLKSIDYNNSLLVFKGTLPQEDEYTITEMGLWSQYSQAINAVFSSKILSTFDSTVNWNNITLDTVNTRTSTAGGRVDVAASSTVSVRNPNVGLNLSGYSAQDSFSVAFYKPDNNITTLALVFENTDTAGAFRSVSQDITSLPVGYNIISISKGSLVSSGTISWDNINSFGIDVTAGTTGSYVTLDGIRVEDLDTIDPDYVLVSRSVVSTPLVKTNVAPMDVEYALEFNVT